MLCVFSDKKLPLRKYLSDFEKGRLIELYQNGFTQKRIADELGCSQQSVSSNISRYYKYGRLDYRWCGGRPRKTSKRDDTMIIREMKKDRRISANQVKINLGLSHISEDTILRRIHGSGEFKSYWSKKKPFVGPKKSQTQSGLVQGASELDC